MKLFFTSLLLSVSLNAALTVSVTAPELTSVGLTIGGATGGDCTLEVSLSGSFTPVIPDVSGIEYTGANTCAGRSDTATSGTNLLVQIGHKVDNRALTASTHYFYRVTSNGGSDIATGSFTTQTIGIGQNIPWPQPVDRRRRFNRGFGPTALELVAKTALTDPLTGSQLFPAVGMADITNREGPFTFANWSDGTGWSNPSHAMDVTSSGAGTNNTNPLTLYIGPESDPNNWIYSAVGWDDLGIMVFACGDDASQTNRNFTLTLSNNFSMGHMGTPITINTATQCVSPPTPLPQVLSASSDTDKPWPSSFPSAPFTGWGSDVLIGWDDRPSTVAGIVTSGVFNATGLDLRHHISPLFEIGNKVVLPGCTQGSGMCDVTVLQGSAKITAPGSTNGATTMTTLRSGIQIQKTTGTGNIWVSVRYKVAEGYLVNTTGGSLQTLCNTDAGTITTGDGHVGYLCTATGYTSGLAFMFFYSEDGTSRLVWTGGRPPLTYFTTTLGWPSGDAPQPNATYFQVGQLVPDRNDPRGWFYYMSNSTPNEVYHLHYSGTVPVIDLGYNYNILGGSPLSPLNYPSDFMDWTRMTPTGSTFAEQLAANFPTFPSSIYGQGQWSLYGESGTTLYFENIRGNQDHAGWVAVGDVVGSPPTAMNLSAVFASASGEGISGKLNYGSIHNVNPRPYPPNTMSLSLNDLPYQGIDPLGWPYEGPWEMPIIAVDRGVVGTPSWDTITNLPSNLNDGSYLSACPSNTLGYTGNRCVHLKAAFGGFCNMNPGTTLGEPANCPTSPPIAGWAASSFSQPWLARVGNTFVDPNVGGNGCSGYSDCENFQIITALVTEGDGFSSFWAARDAAYDYCTLNGLSPALSPPQLVHANGWISRTSPNQNRGCSGANVMIQGKTEGTITTTEVPRIQVGHTDLVKGSCPGCAGFVAATSGNQDTTLAGLFDLNNVKTYATPTWHSSGTTIGGGVQAYSNSPGGTTWFVDGNAINGNSGVSPENPFITLGVASTMTATSCQDVFLITVTGTTDYKHIPLRGVAGSWPLEEVSSPTVDLCSGGVPGYTLAHALTNGEAMHGTISGGGTSLAGQTFVKIPNAEPNYFGQGSCIIATHWVNAPCVFGGNWTGGGFYRRRDILSNDPNGYRSHWLTSGMEVPITQYPYSGIIPLSPTLSWVAWGYASGWGMTPWLLKMPPYVDDSLVTHRTDTINVPVVVGAVSANARVKFGRNPNFYCLGSESTEANATLGWSGRAEACVTDSTVGTYKFVSETQSLQACAAGCTIQVPLIPQVLYYSQVEHLDSGGGVTSTDAIQFLKAGDVSTACIDFAYSPTTFAPTAAGGSVVVAATVTDQSCATVNTPSDSWLTLTTATGGCSISGGVANCTGNGGFTAVAAINGGTARVGTVTPDSSTTTLTVNQGGTTPPTGSGTRVNGVTVFQGTSVVH